jgi:FkbM family methyltransferase
MMPPIRPRKLQYLVALNTYLEAFSRDYYNKMKLAILNSSVVEYPFGVIDGSIAVLAIDGIDRMLCDLFPDTFKPGGKPFIEIGAFDGMQQSNTLYSELKYDMHGILIECQPDAFHWLTNFRSSSNKFVNAAAVPYFYPSDFVTITVEGLVSQSQIDAVMKYTLSDNDCQPSDKASKCIVPAMTMMDIIVDYGSKEFSLFSLDVEGNELSVLEGIDFERVDFDLILVECRDLKRMIRYLASKSYGWAMSFQSGLTHLFINHSSRDVVKQFYVNSARIRSA